MDLNIRGMLMNKVKASDIGMEIQTANCPMIGVKRKSGNKTNIIDRESEIMADSMGFSIAV